MKCEIVTIGSELLCGHIIDTNASLLARQLNLIGCTVSRQTTVGDVFADIRQALEQAMSRADLVIVAGGLGPTEDDLTRNVIAELLGVSLVFKKELMEHIESFFKELGYRMPENNRKQAYIPEGSTPVPNDIGTAPGFISTIRSKVIIALPGVPRELAYIFGKEIVSYVKEYFGLSGETIVTRTLKVTGIGESTVDSRIADLIKSCANPVIGILASPGDISIKISAFGRSYREASELIDPVEQVARSRLGNAVYGIDNDTLEGVVLKLLNERAETLSVMETFSGGALTSKLQRFDSSPLRRSVVIPVKNEIASFLGNKSFSNSPATAEILGEKIRSDANSSLGLAILGIIKPMMNSYQVAAHVAVTGEKIKSGYSWNMGGGSITQLQDRAAIIALNTLRLSLIS